MKARMLLLIAVMAFAAAAAPAADAPRERTLLVHVKTLLDGGTDRTVLVPQTVAGALGQGWRVAVLFDAEGVRSLKLGRWFGGHSTPLDRVRIDPRDRRHLAELLGAASGGLPDIYGSLLHYLKGRGVAVYVNRQALLLEGIGAEQFDHAAEALDGDRIIELLARADRYVSY